MLVNQIQKKPFKFTMAIFAQMTWKWNIEAYLDVSAPTLKHVKMVICISPIDWHFLQAIKNAPHG